MRDCRFVGEERMKKSFCPFVFPQITSKTHRITTNLSGWPSRATWQAWQLLSYWGTSERRVTVVRGCIVITLMMAAPECTVAIATWWNNKHCLLLAFFLPAGQHAMSHQGLRTHTFKHTRLKKLANAATKYFAIHTCKRQIRLAPSFNLQRVESPSTTRSNNWISSWKVTRSRFFRTPEQTLLMFRLCHPQPTTISQRKPKHKPIVTN